jgi:hypothetical protein
VGTANRELAKGIREMVAEARQKIGQGAGSNLSEWLAQAEMIAAKIDPLAPPNIWKLRPDRG